MTGASGDRLRPLGRVEAEVFGVVREPCRARGVDVTKRVRERHVTVAVVVVAASVTTGWRLLASWRGWTAPEPLKS